MHGIVKCETYLSIIIFELSAGILISIYSEYIHVISLYTQILAKFSKYDYFQSHSGISTIHLAFLVFSLSFSHMNGLENTSAFSTYLVQYVCQFIRLTFLISATSVNHCCIYKPKILYPNLYYG